MLLELLFFLTIEYFGWGSNGNIHDKIHLLVIDIVYYSGCYRCRQYLMIIFYRWKYSVALVIYQKPAADPV